MQITSSMVKVKAADGDMSAFLARPTDAGKHPAVIVVMEAFGLNAHIKDVASRLAGEGYVALAPDVYYREANAVVGYDQLGEAIRLMSSLRDDKIVADMATTLSYLQSQDFVRGDRIGITGFCMGGRVSYLAACEIPAIRVAVPFYGGGIAGQQFTPGATAPVPLTGKMRAAIQLHFGENDSYIPLSAVEEIRQALEREKKDYEIHVYKGAGHGFFCRERADYDEEAAKLAWERTKAFLKKHLQS